MTGDPDKIYGTNNPPLSLEKTSRERSKGYYVRPNFPKIPLASIRLYSCQCVPPGKTLRI